MRPDAFWMGSLSVRVPDRIGQCVLMNHRQLLRDAPEQLAVVEPEYKVHIQSRQSCLAFGPT